MINLELYRTFIAIYREGTISKAAIAVDITQPAASQQLASLEKSLKNKLFERTPRQMIPTDLGHELYTKISDAFDWIDHVSKNFSNINDKQTLFTIGVPQEFYNNKLVRHMKDLSFRCHFIFGTTTELATKLEENRLDAMIATYKITANNVIHHDIFTESLWLVAPKELEIPKDYSRSWLIKQRWISYDAKLSIIRKYFKIIYNINPSIAPTLISPNLYSILKAVKAGIGMSVLPDYICKSAVDEGQVVLVHQHDVDITNKLYFVYKNIKKDSLLVKEFLKLFYYNK